VGQFSAHKKKKKKKHLCLCLMKRKGFYHDRNALKESETQSGSEEWHRHLTTTNGVTENLHLFHIVWSYKRAPSGIPKLGPRQVVFVPRCIHIAAAAPKGRAGQSGLRRQKREDFQMSSILYSPTPQTVFWCAECNKISLMEKYILKFTFQQNFREELPLLLFKL